MPASPFSSSLDEYEVSNNLTTEGALALSLAVLITRLLAHVSLVQIK
jgi:hypothetical protein